MSSQRNRYLESILTAPISHLPHPITYAPTHTVTKIQNYRITGLKELEQLGIIRINISGNKKEDSPMLAACSKGHLHIAKWLWVNGAEDDARQIVKGKEKPQ